MPTMNYLEPRRGPLSFEQTQCYKYHFSTDESLAPQVMDLELDFTSPDVPSLFHTIREIYYYNEALRTVLIHENEQVLQQINDLSDSLFGDNYLDFSQLENPELALQDYIRRMVYSMRMTSGTPLSHYFIVRLGPDFVKCIFLGHHIIVDQWSLFILKRQFSEIYSAIRLGNYQRKDDQRAYNLITYALLQKQSFAARGSKTIEFWQNKFRDIKAADRPGFLSIAGKSPPAGQALADVAAITEQLNKGSSKFLVKYIDRKITGDIYAILDKSNVGLMSLFIAALSLLPLASGESKRVLLAMPIRNRFSSKIKQLVGPCGGAVYSYANVPENLTVSEYLRQTYLTVLESAKHLITDHGLFQLDGHVLRARCDCFLNVITNDFGVELSGKHRSGATFSESRTYYSLECWLYEQGKEIYTFWGYNEDFYGLGDVDGIIETLNDIFHFIRQNPDRQIHELKTPIASQTVA
jgi:hypothetical protein